MYPIGCDLRCQRLHPVRKYGGRGFTRMTTRINADMSDDGKLLYAEITYQIRGACFDVWKAFGGAYKETVVERALAHALEKRGLKIENQKRIPVIFEEKIVGHYVPDIIVNSCILIELKCKPFLTIQDTRQFWYYLKGTDYKVALLINFGNQKLEIKRRVFDQARQAYPRPSA